MRVYGDLKSGNCFKVKCLLLWLDLEHEWCPVNILKGESRTDSFLRKNKNGRVPVLETEGGEFISESNAILFYLADGTQLLPSDHFKRAKVLEWLFFEQYSHEPFIAVARYIKLYLNLPEDREQEFMSKQEGGHRALAIMEDALSSNNFLCGGEVSIADISLYAYTHVAEDGGFSLEAYPAIRRWIASIEAMPRHRSMAQLLK